MTEKTIYLIGGLGADKRVFQFLNLPSYNLEHIEWILPSHHETIEHYAQRLPEQIKTPKPILLGVSFGGMMAIEISKLIKTDKVIIISSAKTYKDIPIVYRLFGKIGMIQVLPTSLLKSANVLSYWFFGANKREEQRLMKEILRDTDKKFLKWALGHIVNWRNMSVPENLIHIHGTADRILPFRSADVKIDGGGHLMILNRANEISRFISRG